MYIHNIGKLACIYETYAYRDVPFFSQITKSLLINIKYFLSNENIHHEGSENSSYKPVSIKALIQLLLAYSHLNISPRELLIGIGEYTLHPKISNAITPGLLKLTLITFIIFITLNNPDNPDNPE